MAAFPTEMRDSGSGGYDRVKVAGENGQPRVLSRAEFEELPLAQRVHHLMGGKLVFYRNGVEIAAREALRST
jgi:hypothetical protein